MRQVLLYIAEWKPTGMMNLPRAQPVPLEEKPSRVWTLQHHQAADAPPELPYHPQHIQNAFLEDYVHDWNWRGGMFRYYSRVMDRPVWLLLEYDDPKE